MISRRLGLIGFVLSGLLSNIAFAEDKEKVFTTLALNVLKYVEWSGEDKIAAGQTVRIGVYDKTRGRRYLKNFEQLCEGKEELFELVNLSDPEQVDEATHVVYIAGESTRLPRELLASLQVKGVLVIGENADILKHGGVFRFEVSSEQNAKIGINLVQAKAAGLTIHSRLLDHAVEVIQ